MALVLVVIGLLLIVTGAKDTYRQFGAELIDDFTGDGNFTFWVVSIFAIGAIGYYKPAQGFSRLFLVLIIVAMVLRNGGVFDKLQSALANGPTAPAKDSSSQASNNANGVTLPPLAPVQTQNSNAQANFAKVLGAVKDLLPFFL